MRGGNEHVCGDAPLGDSCGRVRASCSVLPVSHGMSCSGRGFRYQLWCGVGVGSKTAARAAGADSAGSGPRQEENSMTWTDERVEQLKKLWSDGLSASQIAAELGGITRNAVIGKVHRLGLSGRAKSPSSSAPRPRKPRSSTMMRVPRAHIRGNTALAY